jgi:undecaprenyl pyrophosphate synthase
MGNTGRVTFQSGDDMSMSEILASVDREIALLKQVRVLLVGALDSTPSKKRSKTSNAAAKPAKKVAAKKKRRLSPEGRKRIADAVRRRWEAQRKSKNSK